MTGRERWRVGPSAWLEESSGSILLMFTWVFRTPCHLSEYGGNYISTWANRALCHLLEYGGTTVTILLPWHTVRPATNRNMEVNNPLPVHTVRPATCRNMEVTILLPVHTVRPATYRNIEVTFLLPGYTALCLASKHAKNADKSLFGYQNQMLTFSEVRRNCFKLRYKRNKN